MERNTVQTNKSLSHVCQESTKYFVQRSKQVAAVKCLLCFWSWQIRFYVHNVVIKVLILLYCKYIPWKIILYCTISVNSGGTGHTPSLTLAQLFLGKTKWSYCTVLFFPPSSWSLDHLYQKQWPATLSVPVSATVLTQLDVPGTQHLHLHWLLLGQCPTFWCWPGRPRWRPHWSPTWRYPPSSALLPPAPATHHSG